MKKDKILKKLQPDDLMKFGLIPEFIGRVEAVADKIAKTLEDITQDIDDTLDENILNELNLESIEAETASAGGESLLNGQSAEEQGLKAMLSQEAESFDIKIEKAINTSDIGINPTNDGRIIRLVFPQLTEDRRKDLCKDVKKMAEDSRVSVRSTRRDCIDKVKKMEKASEITEDDLKFAEKKLQDITDKYIKEIDKAAEAKEKDIMEI